jgi:hypothetical protein
MLRRLLLALLLLALSAPAVAMGGHCAPQAAPPVDGSAMHHADHGAEHRHSAPAQAERGDCIGCVPPDLGILAAAKPQAPAMVIGTARERPALALARHGPETPPPRS